jgi:hypothetical protein
VLCRRACHHEGSGANNDNAKCYQLYGIAQCKITKLMQVVLEQKLWTKCRVLQEIEAVTSYIPGEANTKRARTGSGGVFACSAIIPFSCGQNWTNRRWPRLDSLSLAHIAINLCHEFQRRDPVLTVNS